MSNGYKYTGKFLGTTGLIIPGVTGEWRTVFPVDSEKEVIL